MSEKVADPVILSRYSRVSTVVEDRTNDIHVTDLVGCLRKAWFSKKYPIPLSKRDIEVLWFGKKAHEFIQLAHPDLGDFYELPLEYYTPSGTRVIGSSDEVLLKNNGDSYMVVDKKFVKTIPPSIYPHHRRQILFYAVMIEETAGLKVDEAGILYISLWGHSNTRSFSEKFLSIRLDDTLKKRAKEDLDRRADTLREHLEKNIPPPPMFTEECEWCKYYSWCLMDYFEKPGRKSVVRDLMEKLQSNITDFMG